MHWLSARWLVLLPLGCGLLLGGCKSDDGGSTTGDGSVITPSEDGSTPPTGDSSTPPPSGDSGRPPPTSTACPNGCPDGQFCNRVMMACQPTTGTPTCNNECQHAGDGDCDDGGRMCDYNLCDYGSDCADCGDRDPSMAPPAGPDGGRPTGIDCPCGVDCGDNSFCDRDSATCMACSCDGRQCGSPGSGCPDCGECPMGSTCDDNGQCQSCECGSRECGSSPTVSGCSCGSCDDGKYCDDNGMCQTCDCTGRSCGRPGSGCESCGDCADGMFCARDTGQCMATAGMPLCNNECRHAGDGDCDDGGPMCDFSLCDFGSDCFDCGMRQESERPADGAMCMRDSGGPGGMK